MAKKPKITTVPQITTNTVTINNNFDAVREAFDNTLSRDGSTPNQMNADIDLNNNDLLNVKSISTENITVTGVTLTEEFERLSTEVDGAITLAESTIDLAENVRDDAETAADAAEADRILAQTAATTATTQAENAAGSAAAASVSEGNALSAATLAGAPFASALPTNDPETAALPSPFLFIAPEGVRSYTHTDTLLSLTQGPYVSRVEFNGVSEVKAWNPPIAPPNGTIVVTRDGVGRYEIDSTLDASDLAGSNVKLKVLLNDNGNLSADAFGFAADGTTDDSAAWSALRTAYIRLLFTPTPSLTGTDTGISPYIEFSTKQYYWETPITLVSKMFIKGNNCTFSGPDGGRLFNGPSNGYRWVFEDVQWWGDDVECIIADMSNINNAEFRFVRNTFSTRVRTEDKFAVDISSQSSRVVFEDCNSRVCPNVLRTDCDFTAIIGGWYQGWMNPGTGNAAPTGARFRIDGRFLNISSGAVFIPEPQGSTRQTGARWIDQRGSTTRIFVDQSHFGAENGGIPIVYSWNSGSYDTGTGRQSSIIQFSNSQLACGSASRDDAGVVVLQDGVVPGWIDIQNCDSIGLAPLISAYGHDTAGDAASQNAALRTDILALDAEDRQNIQITVDRDYGVLPTSLSGFVKDSSKRKIEFINPAAATAIPICDIIKRNPNSSGERSHDEFYLRVTANIAQPSATTLFQEKVFRVIVLSNGTSALVTQISDTGRFHEWARFGAGSEEGDTLISVAVRGTPTSTFYGLDLTLADEVTAYRSVQVELLDYVWSRTASGSQPAVPILVGP